MLVKHCWNDVPVIKRSSMYCSRVPLSSFRSFKSWLRVSPKFMREFLNPVVRLPSSTECWPEILGPAIQKQTMAESPDQPESKRGHLLSPVLSTRGCPRVHCSPKCEGSEQGVKCPVQCRLWPFNLVQTGMHPSEVSWWAIWGWRTEWRGWLSPYTQNFWPIGYIPPRASFRKGYCLLLGVLAPDLRSVLTKKAHLALPGLPAAHTVGFTWSSICSGQGCASSHSLNDLMRNCHACSRGTCRWSCCSSGAKVIWARRFDSKSQERYETLSDIWETMS